MGLKEFVNAYVQKKVDASEKKRKAKRAASVSIRVYEQKGKVKAKQKLIKETLRNKRERAMEKSGRLKEVINTRGLGAFQSQVLGKKKPKTKRRRKGKRVTVYVR